MKKPLFLPLFFLLHFHAYAQEINIYFHNIGDLALIGTDHVFIQIAVTSTNSIASVTAEIEGRDTALVYNEATTFYEGTLSLAGLPANDTVALNITAVDVLNNKQTASRRIIYDLYPVITLLSPLNQSVARPLITIKAKVDYWDSCILWIKYNTSGEVYLYKGKMKDSAEVTLDLSAYNGIGAGMTITIADKRGRGSNIYVPYIYVESSPLLSEVYAADTSIMDFNYNKIFVRRDSTKHPAIIDIGTKERTTVPVDGDIHDKASITPFGAIFNFYNQTSQDYVVEEFNQGNIYQLSKNYSSYFWTKGNYVSWVDYVNSRYRIYFRDMSKLSQSELPPANADVTTGDIADNGFLVYAAGNNMYKLYSYQNGIVTKLGDTSDNKSTYAPITDGNFVVYTKIDTTSLICLYDGQSHSVIGNYNSYPYYTFPYLANNKFIAYIKPDSLKKNQVWLRDSLGITKQQTFFKNSCGIEFLNSQGDMMVNAGRRYLVLRSGETFEIGFSNFGKPYYRDSSWYVTIGRMLYKITPSHILPLKLLSFEAQKQGAVNTLAWSVTNDNNCSYISIERSTDARNFYPIGEINATSHGTLTNYNYTDNNPLPGANYYRLKIVDKNATFQYSAVREVDNTVNLSVLLFPNPTRNSFDLKVNSINTFDAFIEIIDMKGKVVFTQKKSISAGTSIHNFNIVGLNKGVYYLRIEGGSNRVNLKFVKL